MFCKLDRTRNNLPVIPWTHNFLDSLVRKVSSSGNPGVQFRYIRYGRYRLCFCAGAGRYCMPSVMLPNPKDYSAFEVIIEDWGDEDNPRSINPVTDNVFSSKSWVPFFINDGLRGQYVPIDVVRNIIVDLEGHQLKDCCEVKK